MKKKAFTLIELISVLVILAILALIVTPLVMNIIKKAKFAANKRSIDAYGRSIELAIAAYLMDEGRFPTSIDELTIEYKGANVVCETKKINSDSSVYLTGCTVGGKSVDYSYGEDKDKTYESYEIGDVVMYNNVAYYVIKNSGEKDSTLTLLKAEPITSSEISPYLQSTEVASKVNTNGKYATMAYYLAGDCVSAGDISGCTTDYAVSDVKQVVDVWKANYAPLANESRLITIDELIDDLGYEYNVYASSLVAYPTNSAPSWGYNSSYDYWTISPGTSDNSILAVASGVWASSLFDVKSIRPVITITKSNEISKVTTYNVGDQVEYNNIDFYVIKDNLDSNTVTLLKKDVFTVDDVNNYNSGHANRYTHYTNSGSVKDGYAYKLFGRAEYGGVAYYTSENCSNMNGKTGCTTNYGQSDIKYIIDAWANAELDANDLVEDSTGYSVRLITIDELRNNLGYGSSNDLNGNVPSWVAVEHCYWWTMSQNPNEDTNVWYVSDSGKLGAYGFYRADGVYTPIGGDSMHGSYYAMTIRPVIVVKKSALNS